MDVHFEAHGRCSWQSVSVTFGVQMVGRVSDAKHHQRYHNCDQQNPDRHPNDFPPSSKQIKLIKIT